MALKKESAYFLLLKKLTFQPVFLSMNLFRAQCYIAITRINKQQLTESVQRYRKA
ncbi:hypothetical protein AALB_1941 [Agarivorans albus MKT 106]|uniref:Uncharacterized protein n=1 Tax=Agarivorans albus MKT 106 TaxID=1331007 RepID=R9PT61_AGAAL|nr:hypothetical protein AALB_1941 [Agarivorans albus MKT 106]